MEVHSSNFEKFFPIVIKNIEKCSFVALDLEFTGLYLNDKFKPSLFDSLEERYKKCRLAVQSFIPCQVGLSFFTKDVVKNRYETRTFSFYCCPRFLGTSTLKQVCLDPSSVEFLAENNFDFNKFARYGISYMNEMQEDQFRKDLKNYESIELPNSAKIVFNDLSLHISDWLLDANSETQIFLDFKLFLNSFLDYLVIRKLRFEYKTLWFELINDSLLVTKVSKQDRQVLEQNILKEDEAIINYLSGFSRIFQKLVASRKPLIGNNMFSDLLMIYNHFHRPLPTKLKKFKQECLKLFPLVFDTKLILLKLKNKHPELNEYFSSKTLFDLYSNLSKLEFLKQCPHQPVIDRIFSLNEEEHIKSPHDAGFDAFATGYVFIRLCLVKMMKDELFFKNSWDQVLTSISLFKNQINLIQANCYYLDLESSSQLSDRPNWLIIKCRKKSSNFCLSKILPILSSHGSFDLKLINSKEALLAVSNYQMSKNVIKFFQNNKDYKIVRYNIFIHSPKIRNLLWSTFIFATGLSLCLIYKVMK